MREDADERGRGVNKRKMYVFQEVPFASPDFASGIKFYSLIL